MQSEESNTLVKLAKAVIEHAPEGGDAFWDIKFSDIEAALFAAEPVEAPFQIASKHIPEARVSLLSRAIRQGLNDYGWKNFGTLPEVLMGYIVEAERAEAEAHPQQPAPSAPVKALHQAASDFMHLFIQDGQLTVQGLEDTDLIPAYEKLSAALSAQVQDVAGLERLRDVTYAVQHNPNCPAKYLARLVGKSGRIDLKPYGNHLPRVKHETGDVLGFGKTLDEAIDNALAAAAPAKQEG